ncbi:HAD family hydrolase [Romboutsia sp. 1001216sp1]|uniref:HAD family hydrolase n=1 Tax=unclassified Romboutsia TaxID=2626894 RepID=UPI00189ABF7E|nr:MULTISPECIES: HAD family hydrolase [unclassified Romboutsia]MDB8792389.1 HAD family hydrolase [Romboutsia sp. 1001216sp1]MDB8795684.1 HAD family hydrolase [Romboutsia sp. 1001216sp1]MDB8798437.1 HAD family hydrolase [Romboutsia sp. 1001216sp1]MDB8800849.1 HAD family hydrolase [Romboutsia sp. 1001216sp1]MDB8803871.1 HAD family hydrolase [Romboutsia sp. 1001216sp1]
MIKLIATDMDGTLLNNNNEIHHDFIDVFEKLQEKDIIFAAASGRQYFNLLKRFEDVKDKMMFIAENGTIVVYKGEEIFINSLDRNIAKELVNIGRNIENSNVILCGKNSAYIESTDEEFIKEVEKYYEKYEVVKDVNEIEDDILKVTICDFNGAQENSNKYYDDYRDDLQVSISGKIWLDITNKGANKGMAIKALQEKMGIDFNETMVFGDYLNDLEMMEAAYHSYAMENAHDDLKKVSRFIAKSNDDNGVLEAIKLNIL